jgi:phenylacetate-CoA ligase
MRRMGKIVGRSDDMLIIRGVNLFPTQIEEMVLQHGQLSGSTSWSSPARGCWTR